MGAMTDVTGQEPRVPPEPPACTCGQTDALLAYLARRNVHSAADLVLYEADLINNAIDRRGAQRDRLRAALDFIADWANDCATVQDGELKVADFGFRDIYQRARAALSDPTQEGEK